MKLRITEQQYRFLIESEEEESNPLLFDFTKLSKTYSDDPDIWDVIFEQKNKLNIKNGGKKYDGYYINGDVDLSKSDITELNYLVKVGGYLILRFTPITELPMLSYVGGNLYLNYTQITELPMLSYVGSNLYLGDTPLGEELNKTMSKEEIKNKFGVKHNLYI